MDSGKYFFSCDWGTSSFRLRLVEAETLTILLEVANNNGITACHELWKQSGLQESDPLSFYQSIMAAEILSLQQQTDQDLSDIPIVLSGMVSSSLGMIELPYKSLPFLMDGSDLGIHVVNRSKSFMHEMVIVSGVRSDDDVMRGEETQLVGCFSRQQLGQQLFILPGTHSKHITVVDNQVVDFQTFMTGEVFRLLSTKSILSASIEYGTTLEFGTNKESFIEGVNDSSLLNPLHAFFLVRTNFLFRRKTKQENLYYLSGLLIGMELKEIGKKDCKITLMCSHALQANYETAFQQLGFEDRLFTINVDEAMVRGHYRVYCNYLRPTLSSASPSL
jgi:2-dehydro-3-deoxygalactonokinase